MNAGTEVVLANNLILHMSKRVPFRHLPMRNYSSLFLAIRFSLSREPSVTEDESAGAAGGSGACLMRRNATPPIEYDTARSRTGLSTVQHLIHGLYEIDCRWQLTLKHCNCMLVV